MVVKNWENSSVNVFISSTEPPGNLYKLHNKYFFELGIECDT